MLHSRSPEAQPDYRSPDWDALHSGRASTVVLGVGTPGNVRFGAGTAVALRWEAATYFVTLGGRGEGLMMIVSH